ncbi:hypothetical protein [Oceanobacillus salinisoli]|uniref:hypothetical protein n=1 Tax=Oceanobacillus salinisoli TaxID=2678611 RepID=UPI0012E1BF92|nr:hypothetical protein [Oceanobacillus salinisoli]
MAKADFSSKGDYRQKLMRKERVPTKEARERAEGWVLDDEVLRFFVDASELKEQGIFGLGVCIVGQGETRVESKKHYNSAMKKQNTYAELVAVHYALELLPHILRGKIALPENIIVYSDWNEVGRLKETSEITKNKMTNELAKQINEKKESFIERRPGIGLEVSYMSKDLKKWNPYYKAAHNAARNIFH